MNKLIKIALLSLALPVLFLSGCERGAELDGEVVMTARVTAIGDRLEVEVIASEYTSGPHWVIIDKSTKFEYADGSRASKSDLKEGDTVEIRYNGQVMLSYPPQIVAHKIIIK